MRMGTKSLLFGAHQFLVHPIMVAIAWRQLYGWPWHPLLWFSFLVHDWGYWGKAAMDNADGETHPLLGARILGLFGKKWYWFVLYHSRFLAAQHGQPYSRLCLADKLAVATTPKWLYLPLVKLTGEIKEYKALAVRGKYQKENRGDIPDDAWFTNVQTYLKFWVYKEYRNHGAA